MLKRSMPMPDLSEPDRNAVIAALRAEMKSQDLDAFILPRYDAFQGEYVAPCDERLAHVTGFTGSAGLAIVTQKDVALFVDGRYAVQAENQCSGPLFTHLHLFNDLPEDWLACQAQQGWRVGFDAMHIPPAWYDRFAKALTQGALIATPRNPVDEIWPDQPAAPTGEITQVPVQISGKPSQEKIDDLAMALRAEGVDLLVETQPDNIAWLLNVRGSDVEFNTVSQSFALIDASGQVEWFVEGRKLEQDIRDHLPNTVQVSAPESFLPSVRARVPSGEIVMFDPDFSPVAVRQVLEQAGAKPEPRPSLLARTKSCKNPVELEGIRSCHLQDGIAWTEFNAWLAHTVPHRAEAGHPVTEREAEHKIVSLRRERDGFLDSSFNPISASGGNAAMCHYATMPDNSVPIPANGTYLLDSGGQYETGTTDTTRSFAFGANRPEGYDRAYTAVFKAFFALLTLRFPMGTQGHHIDAICRRPLWDLGLDYDHGTGHGVGHRLSVHEQPQRIGKPYNPVDLAPGMVLSIEPGYYEADCFGIRIENLFEVVEGTDGFMGFSNLTWCPIQKDMLILEHLTRAEIDWLNSYHAELLDRLGPHLSESALTWARNACAPISE